MQGTVVEYIHGMSVVKVFNRTLSAFRRYEGDLNHFTDVVERTARANARPMGGLLCLFRGAAFVPASGGPAAHPHGRQLSGFPARHSAGSFWWAAD